MTTEERARKVFQQMYAQDYFSQWLGIELIEADAGRSVLRLTVRREMLNGFGIAHGGITYSLADSALAFASNSHGRKAVSIETSISHLASLREGDVLTAYAEEESLGHKIAVYQVLIKNQTLQTVALFKGTVYRRSEKWAL
ncbi:MAG TPA: hydroxyphenylacetyl-CoA thioesterase PaaI [Saprospiraceae bacterium]|nr:hydroxyphenylacetyl-CoA thioesterase PaaI [Saprospiraceae bacterium]HMP24150.1 hydroxyphenylacetyl-CoA thioesterase PaaI [Saprospiraceae bacterium]